MDNLKEALNLIIKDFAYGCLVHILNSKHNKEIIEVAYQDEIIGHEAKEMYERTSLLHDSPSSVVFEDGKSLLFPFMMCIPLTAVKKTIGTATFVRSPEQKPFVENDLKLAESICSKFAWSIDCSIRVEMALK